MKGFTKVVLWGLLLSISVAVHAQTVSVSNYGPSIDLAQATRLIDGARTYAEKKSMAISIVVLDTAGHLVASVRMDGAPFSTPEIARGKAYASIAAGGVPGDQLAIRYKQNPMVWGNTASLGYGAPLLPAEGSLPIFLKNVLAGSVGASGAPSDDDVNAIRAGIAAIGATSERR